MRLARVRPVRIPDWGSRESLRQRLKTIGDMAQSRTFLHSKSSHFYMAAEFLAFQLISQYFPFFSLLGKWYFEVATKVEARGCYVGGCKNLLK